MEHLAQLRRRLDEWAERVAAGATEEEFVAAAIDSPAAAEYDRAMPLWQSYAGLRRWADKQRPAA